MENNSKASFRLSSYPIIENKICSPGGCEINITLHCNLSCSSCSHFSPISQAKFLDITEILTDLEILSKYYKPSYIKLLGGEPLLHPKIDHIVSTIRESMLSDQIQICTNGLLLSKMSALFWEQVDHVLISSYPGKHLSKESLKRIKRLAKENNVKITIEKIKKFRIPFSYHETDDENIISQIYSTCKMAHVWHCHTIANGYFFKCPMGYFLPLNITSQNISKNGVKIRDCTTFFEELIDYLACDNSLPACKNCLGSVGKLVSHSQVSKRQWSTNHEKPLEYYIDWRFLSSLQSIPDIDNGCIRFSREKKFALRVYSYLGKIKSIITRILPIIRIPRV